MLQIGDRIKEMRIKNGYTQSELAIMLGLKLTTLQKYESGAIINLKLDTLRELCAIFYVPPIYFVFPNLTEKCKAGVIKWCMSEYSELNEEGYKKVMDYIKDLQKIDAYKK